MASRGEGQPREGAGDPWRRRKEEQEESKGEEILLEDAILPGSGVSSLFKLNST